ncbi:serine hydrolase domain-containing protein [Nonomuraea thailandensis]
MSEIHGVCEPRFHAVREAFARNFDEGRELGASVAVYRRGRAVVDLWGGQAGRDAAWRQDTITLLASATKGLVATAAMLLVDRGLLDLDAPIAEYWPEFAAGGKADIPLRWVLGHRSGVVTVDPPLTMVDIEGGTAVGQALAAAVPAWEPGRAHGYHCLTMGWLVGEVIRRVTGLSVQRFFAQEIAGPLGLDLHIGLPDTRERLLACLVPPTEEQLLQGRANPELAGLNRAICDPASLFHRSTFGSIALAGNPWPPRACPRPRSRPAAARATRRGSPACTPPWSVRWTASACCARRPPTGPAPSRRAAWIWCCAAAPRTGGASCSPAGRCGRATARPRPSATRASRASSPTPTRITSSASPTCPTA